MSLVVPRRGRANFTSGRIAPWTFRRNVVRTIAFATRIPEPRTAIKTIQRLATSIPLFRRPIPLFRRPIPLFLPLPLFFFAPLYAARASSSLSLPKY